LPKRIRLTSHSRSKKRTAFGCTKCHSVDKDKKGPAFKKVAAKYKGKADAEATLTAKLSKGEGHPAVKASPADVTSLVKWVLSQ